MTTSTMAATGLVRRTPNKVMRLTYVDGTAMITTIGTTTTPSMVEMTRGRVMVNGTRRAADLQTAGATIWWTIAGATMWRTTAGDHLSTTTRGDLLSTHVTTAGEFTNQQTANRIFLDLPAQLAVLAGTTTVPAVLQVLMVAGVPLAGIID